MTGMPWRSHSSTVDVHALSRHDTRRTSWKLLLSFIKASRVQSLEVIGGGTGGLGGPVGMGSGAGARAGASTGMLLVSASARTLSKGGVIARSRANNGGAGAGCGACRSQADDRRGLVTGPSLWARGRSRSAGTRPTLLELTWEGFEGNSAMKTKSEREVDGDRKQGGERKRGRKDKGGRQC